MNNQIKISIILSIVVALAQCHSIQSKDQLSKISMLPKFIIQSVDRSSLINTSEIDPKNALVFVYFSPDCEICKGETQEILTHTRELKDINFYLITSDSSQEIAKFITYFRLDTAKNIFVGRDENYSFYNTFLPKSVPFLVIYDANKKLKKIYDGATPITSIVTATQKN